MFYKISRDIIYKKKLEKKDVKKLYKKENIHEHQHMFRLHDYEGLLLYKFEQANVPLCMPLPVHLIQNLCYRFLLPEHDHNLVVYLLRCKPFG